MNRPRSLSGGFMRCVSSLLLCLSLAACGQPERFEQLPVVDEDMLLSVRSNQERIRIVGSSTVAPFSITVSEHFGETTRYLTPIVESTGTGGGFKTFCQGVGVDKASVVNASRRIKPGERALCQRRGIENLIEIKIGFDGIVFANRKDARPFDLTKAQIYKALAAELPDGSGGWKRNTMRSWQDVDPDLPDQRIIVAGPPPTSGTRDAFVELVLVPGARTLSQLSALEGQDQQAFLQRAANIRNDGVWIDSGENDNGIVNMLWRNEDAIGVLGYSFLQQNLDRVKAAHIGGVTPAFRNIFEGRYGISRSMFIYVKGEHRTLVPGLPEFVREFTAEHAWGTDGYLVEKGLIPLLQEERMEVRQRSLDALL